MTYAGVGAVGLGAMYSTQIPQELEDAFEVSRARPADLSTYILDISEHPEWTRWALDHAGPWADKLDYLLEAAAAAGNPQYIFEPLTVEWWAMQARSTYQGLPDSYADLWGGPGVDPADMAPLARLWGIPVTDAGRTPHPAYQRQSFGPDRRTAWQQLLSVAYQLGLSYDCAQTGTWQTRVNWLPCASAWAMSYPWGWAAGPCQDEPGPGFGYWPSGVVVTGGKGPMELGPATLVGIGASECIVPPGDVPGGGPWPGGTGEGEPFPRYEPPEEPIEPLEPLAPPTPPSGEQPVPEPPPADEPVEPVLEPGVPPGGFQPTGGGGGGGPSAYPRPDTNGSTPPAGTEPGAGGGIMSGAAWAVGGGLLLLFFLDRKRGEK